MIINIDNNELKNLNVKFDLKICEDVKNFFNWIHKKNLQIILAGKQKKV